MRVVYGVFCQPERGGGIGRVAYELADFFAKNKFNQILLVRPGRSTRIKKIGPNYSQLMVKSIGEGEVVIPSLNFKNIKLIFRILNKFSPKVIHLHDFGPIAFLLQVWALRNKVPVILTAHILPDKAMDFGATESLQKLAPFLESKILKNYLYSFFLNCEAVIALNQKVKEEVEKFGYHGKIFIVPNGRDLSLYKEPKPFQDLKKKKKLIFIGHLTHRKNQQYLLLVLRYLPSDFCLDLVGEALSPKYKEKLKKIIKKENLKNVHLLGKVNHQLVPKYLKESLVFVSASKMEVQSLAVIEALASGTPVVSLSNETTDELIDSSVGYNLPKNTSPKQFAQKILKISQLSLQDYKKLSQMCRKRVSHLNWSEIVKKTAKVYQQVIMDYGNSSKKQSAFLTKLKTDKIKRLEEKLSQFFSKNSLYFILTIVAVYVGGSALSFSKRIQVLKKRIKFKSLFDLKKLKKGIFESRLFLE